jgi:hypothetical protein
MDVSISFLAYRRLAGLLGFRGRRVVQAPQGKMPDVPKGFAVQVFARGLKSPASFDGPKTGG